MRSTFKNFKYSARKGLYFSFDLAGIPSILIFSIKKRGGWGGGEVGGLLNEQNLLSVTEVICQQSLKCLAKYPTDFYEISPAEERSLIIVEFELHYTMLYCVSKFY